MPAQPSHKFVSLLHHDHIGFPDPKWKVPSAYTRNANSRMFDGPAHPGTLIPIIALECGYNHARIQITHTSGSLQALISFVDYNAVDYKVGDYVNLRAYGGVADTADGYCKVLNVYAGGYTLLVEVPAGFVAPTLVDEAIEDLLFPYTYFTLQGNTSITNDDSYSKNRAIASTSGTTPTMTSTAPLFGTESIRLHAASGASAIRFNSYQVSMNGGVDFALDGWWKITESSMTGLRNMCGWGVYNATTCSEGLRVDPATGLVEWYEVGTTRITSNDALVVGTWKHIAVTRSEGTARMFIDGVLQTQTYNASYSESDTRTFTVGSPTPSGSTAFPGNLAYLRITLGHPRWTTTFQTNDVMYVPKNRPGVGVFACRGGNILTRPDSDYAYSRTPDIQNQNTRFRYSAFLSSYQAAFPDTTLLATFRAQTSFNISITTPVYGTMFSTYYGYDHPRILAGSSNYASVNLGAFYPHISTDTINTAVYYDMAFVVSNAGFYHIIRRRTGDGRVVRTGVQYFGKTQQLARNDTGLTDADIADKELAHFGFNSDVNASTSGTYADDLYAAHVSASGCTGLLMSVAATVPLALVTSTTSPTYSYRGTRKSPVANTTIHSVNLPESVGVAPGTPPAVPVSSFYTSGSIAATQRPALTRYLAPFAADSVAIAPGSRWDAFPAQRYEVCYPKLPFTKMLVTVDGTQKNVLSVYGFNTMGVISLDVADWE